MRRLATQQDIEAVHAIYSHEQVLPYLTYERMPLDDFRPIYLQLLDSRCFHVWETDGEIAGFYKAARHAGRASHVVEEGRLRDFYKRAGQAHYVDELVMGLLLD